MSANPADWPQVADTTEDAARLFARRAFINRLAQELDVSPARAAQALANLEARGLIAPPPTS